MSTESTSKAYIGRFAPSPTGPLHFGSLVAAVTSYCDAKSRGGKWLLRMEDLDKPREVAGAADTILRQLDLFGFEWEGEVTFQSQRDEMYADALSTLQNKGLIYPCTCTRKEIADSSSTTGVDGIIYPKTCLNTPAMQPNTPGHPLSNSLHELDSPCIHAAYRAVVLDSEITFSDAIQGEIVQNLARDVGDFIIKRADGLFAYQLAVVVDDAAQNVSHIVRGADLLDSTPRQIYLQQLLGFSTPTYAHVPLASNDAGEKLSKQTRAEPISTGLPAHQLVDALSFLGQQAPAEIRASSLDDIWHWAIAHWDLDKVPKQRKIIVHA